MCVYVSITHTHNICIHTHSLSIRNCVCVYVCQSRIHTTYVYTHTRSLYVIVCVCMCVSITHTHNICINTHTLSLRNCVCVYACVYVCQSRIQEPKAYAEVGFREIFWQFVLLGWTAFGGPQVSFFFFIFVSLLAICIPWLVAGRKGDGFFCFFFIFYFFCVFHR